MRGLPSQPRLYEWEGFLHPPAQDPAAIISSFCALAALQVRKMTAAATAELTFLLCAPTSTPGVLPPAARKPYQEQVEPVVAALREGSMALKGSYDTCFKVRIGWRGGGLTLVASSLGGGEGC